MALLCIELGNEGGAAVWLPCLCPACPAHLPPAHACPARLGAPLSLPLPQVFGTDYPTRDGTCLRDYIHVMDLVGGWCMVGFGWVGCWLEDSVVLANESHPRHGPGVWVGGKVGCCG